MRLVIMGTAAFGLPALRRLAASEHEIVAVYTQPPRPAGRGQKEQRTPVHDVALELGLDVRTPVTLKDEATQQAFADLYADLAVVAAYGLLLPKPILAAPRLGCINLHGSLLPRWRGAAPIERAILAGDAETGVDIFQMEPGLDTGPVFASVRTPIGPRDTAPMLHGRLAELAADILPDTLAGIAAGTLQAKPQATEGVTYAAKLDRGEGRLDFSSPADELDRKLRALNPRPGCFVEVRGERLNILAGEPIEATGEPGTVIALPLTVACGSGALRVDTVQRAGRKAMTAAELQRGFALPLGSRLG
ncbi:MAG: methionyl-tRNA formyltransferase [Geminicoccaceae bacterium]